MTSDKKSVSLMLETSIPSIPSSKLPYNSNDSIILESFSASLTPNPKHDHLEKLISFVTTLLTENFSNHEEFQESVQILNEQTLKALSVNKDPTFLRVLKAYGWTGMRFQSLTNADPKHHTFDFQKFLQALSNIYLKLQYRNPVSLENILDSEGINHIEKIAAFCPDIVIEYLEKYPRLFASTSTTTNPTNLKPSLPSVNTSHTFFGACMLIDISGFSKFSAAMCSQGIRGLDELRKVTNGLLGKFVKAVYEHDGDVIAFAGDAIICVFREYDQIPTSTSVPSVLTTPQASQSMNANRKGYVSFATPMTNSNNTKPTGLPKGKSAFNLFGGYYGSTQDMSSTAAGITTTPGTGHGDTVVNISPENKISSLKQVDACIRALHCAHLLHTVQYVELATHIGISYSKMYMSFLGGHHGQYQYVINGKCFTQLSSCIEDAQRQMVVVTRDVYDRIHSLPYETSIQYPTIRFQKIDASVNYQVLDLIQTTTSTATHIFDSLFSITGRDNIQNILYKRKQQANEQQQQQQGLKSDTKAANHNKGIGVIVEEDEEMKGIPVTGGGNTSLTNVSRQQPSQLSRKYSILQQSANELPLLSSRKGSSRNLSIRHISMDSLYPNSISPPTLGEGHSTRTGGELNLSVSGSFSGAFSGIHSGRYPNSNHPSLHIQTTNLQNTANSDSTNNTATTTGGGDKKQQSIFQLNDHSISSILSPSSFYMKRNASQAKLANTKPPTLNETSLESYRTLIESLTMFLPLPIISALHAESNHQIGELRTVTTMFLCLNSFSFEKNLDPLTLQPFFLIAQQALVTTGGFLRQFLIDDKGCVLIGMWGVPSYTYANNASRAIYCAVDIQQRVTKEIDHHISIGITTGTVFCGTIGALERCDYVGIGNEVNLAARFMSKAKEKIYIDSSTYERLNSFNRQLFVIGPELTLKGMPAPIRPYVYTPSNASMNTEGEATPSDATVNAGDTPLPTIEQSTRVSIFDPTEEDTGSKKVINMKEAVDAVLHPAPIIMPSLNSIDHRMSMKNKLLRRKVIHLLEKQLDKLNNNYGTFPMLFDNHSGKESPTNGDKKYPKIHGNHPSNEKLYSQTMTKRKQFIATKLFPPGSSPDNVHHNQSFSKHHSFKQSLKYKQQQYHVAKQKAAGKGGSIQPMNEFWRLNSIDITILCGHSGSGKSTAVQYFRYSARERNLPTIAIQAQSKHKSIPFGVIKDIFVELVGKDNFKSKPQQKSVLDALLLELFSNLPATSMRGNAKPKTKEDVQKEKHKWMLLLYAIFNVSAADTARIAPEPMNMHSTSQAFHFQGGQMLSSSSSSFIPFQARTDTNTFYDRDLSVSRDIASPTHVNHSEKDDMKENEVTDSLSHTMHVEQDLTVMDVEDSHIPFSTSPPLNGKTINENPFPRNYSDLSIYEGFANALEPSPLMRSVHDSMSSLTAGGMDGSPTRSINTASTEAILLLNKLLVILLKVTPTVLIIENAHFCDELTWKELFTLLQDPEINISVLITMKTNTKHRTQQLKQQQSRLRATTSSFLQSTSHLPLPQSSFLIAQQQQQGGLITQSMFSLVDGDGALGSPEDAAEGCEDGEDGLDAQQRRLFSLGLEHIQYPAFLDITRLSNCLIYELKNLTFEEVKHVLKHMLKTSNISDSLVKIVFDISSGNTFWCKMIANFILENGVEHLEETLQVSMHAAMSGSNDGTNTIQLNGALLVGSGIDAAMMRSNSGINASAKSAFTNTTLPTPRMDSSAAPGTVISTANNAPKPHALQQIILYRIEMLSMDLQIILRYASIIGFEFTLSILQAILPAHVIFGNHKLNSQSSAALRSVSSGSTLEDHMMPDPQRSLSDQNMGFYGESAVDKVVMRSSSNHIQVASLLSLLEILEKHGFIYCVSEEENMPQSMVFAFQNELIQTTIYELVPPSDASTVHASIAMYIEQEYGDNLRPFYPTLAYHYQLSNKHELAFKYEIKSAALALSVGAYNDCYMLTVSSLSLASSTDQYDLLLDVCEKAIMEITPMADILPVMTKPTPRRHMAPSDTASHPTTGGGIRSMVHTFSHTFASFFVKHNVRTEADPQDKQQPQIPSLSTVYTTEPDSSRDGLFLPKQSVTPERKEGVSTTTTPRSTQGGGGDGMVLLMPNTSASQKKLSDLFTKQPSFLLPQPTTTSAAVVGVGGVPAAPAPRQSSFNRPAQSAVALIPQSIIEESESSSSMMTPSYHRSNHEQSMDHTPTNHISMQSDYLSSIEGQGAPRERHFSDPEVIPAHDKHSLGSLKAVMSGSTRRRHVIAELSKEDEDSSSSEDDVGGNHKIAQSNKENHKESHKENQPFSSYKELRPPQDLFIPVHQRKNGFLDTVDTRSDISEYGEHHTPMAPPPTISSPPGPHLTTTNPVLTTTTALLAAFHALRSHVFSLKTATLKRQGSRNSLISLTDITGTFYGNGGAGGAGAPSTSKEQQTLARLELLKSQDSVSSFGTVKGNMTTPTPTSSRTSAKPVVRGSFFHPSMLFKTNSDPNMIQTSDPIQTEERSQDPFSPLPSGTTRHSQQSYAITDGGGGMGGIGSHVGGGETFEMMDVYAKQSSLDEYIDAKYMQKQGASNTNLDGHLVGSGETTCCVCTIS